MRTIIPFPNLKALGAKRRPADGAAPGGVQAAPEKALRQPKLPEGETVPADTAGLPPRARAMHSGIIDLIQAVRNRFG